MAASYALLGDSQGVGVAPRLRQLLPIVFEGPVVGYTTPRTLTEVLPHALASDATDLLVVTGGNDTPRAGVAAITELVRRALAAGKRVTVVGPVFSLHQPEKDLHDAVHYPLLDAASRAGASIIDAYPLTQDLARPENVHLTAANYRIYAQRIAGALERRATTGLGILALVFVGAYAAWRWLR